MKSFQILNFKVLFVLLINLSFVQAQGNPDSIILGRTSYFLEGRNSIVTTQETNLGNLATDAILWQAQQAIPTVKVGIRHAGSIQSYIGTINGTTLGTTAANPTIGKNAGDISQLDLQTAIPANSGLSVISLTPAQLKSVIEYSLSTAGGSRFPQISGMRIRFNLNLAANNRVVEIAAVNTFGAVTDTIVYKGSVYGNATRTIEVVTLSSLANGGEGFPVDFAGSNRVNLDTLLASNSGSATFAAPGTDQDAIAEYLLANSSNLNLTNPETAIAEDWRLQQINAGTQACIFAPENPVLQLVSGSLCNCPSNSTITFKTDTVYNASFYYWQIKTGNGVIASGGNQKRATFNFNPNALLAEVTLTASNICGSSKEVSAAFPDVSIWDGENWSKGKPNQTTDGILADRVSSARGFSTLDSFSVRNLYISSGNQAIIPFGCDIYGDIVNLNTGYNMVAIVRIMGTDTTEVKGVPFHFGGGSLLVKPGAVLKTNDNLIYGYKSDSENGAINGLAFGVGTPGGGGQLIGNVSLRKKGIASNLQLEFWSSPVVGATTSVLGNRDVRSFNPINQTWTPSGFGQSLPSNTTMQIGQGYTATNPGVVNFFGAPNNGNINFPLVLNGGSNDDWNLVGNPYPGVLNLSQFINDNVANFTGSIYKWEKPFVSGLNNNNFSGSDYTVYNLLNNFNVQAMEGFFVEAIGTTLNFNNSQRDDSYMTGFRTSSNASKIRVALTNSQNEGRTTLIGFTSQAGNGFDHGYDAKYLNGYTNLGISSMLNNERMAIQAFGPLVGARIVDLELHSNSVGTHTITVDTLENIDPNTTIFLEDLASGQMHNLLMSGYNFQVNQAGPISNRFKLHINSLVTSTQLVEKTKPTIFSFDDVIVLNGLNSDSQYQLRVLDLSGRLVHVEVINQGSSKVELKPVVSEGAYLVQLNSMDGQISVNQKVIIKK